MLRDNECKYSIFDGKFLVFLEYRPFTAYTDHKPLIFTISYISDHWSAHQQRLLVAVYKFKTDIQHGKSNLVADCLSPALVFPVYVGIDFSGMAAGAVIQTSLNGSLSLLPLKGL